MKELIEKRRNGDALLDEELDQLIEYYSNLTSLLREQGERGHIYWYYFFIELDTLLSFKHSRQR